MLRKIYLCLAILLFTGCISEQEEIPEVIERVHVGDMLPSFEITMNDDRRVCTTNLAGKPSMIVLFHTDCPDCRRELPVIQEVYDRAGDRFTLLCIAREEDAEHIATYWTSRNLTMPYSAQPDRQVFNLFASANIPRVYVADSTLHVTAAFTDDKQPLSTTALLQLLFKSQPTESGKSVNFIALQSALSGAG